MKSTNNVIRHSKTLSDGGVISNSALKRKYYGRFSSNGFCFRDGWCSSIGSSGKINKDFETKGNSRRGLQRRVMHCSKTLCYGGVVSNGELNKKFMFNPTIRLETNLFSLVQLEQSHYEELYTVASNPIVWEQHQEKNRWQEENFLKFFQKAIQNNNGCFVVFNKN